jgi:hypothetical protein
MMSYDASIWRLTGDQRGKTYASIPTEHPSTWRRRTDGLGPLVYTSGPYTIVREPYGVSRWSYSVKRNGHRLFGLYSRLKDAKAHAERNAAGQEIVHVA